MATSNKTGKWSLPLWVTSMFSPWTNVNETLEAVDALMQIGVQAIDLLTPPVSPNDGECWLIPVTGTATDEWFGENGKLAKWVAGDDEWRYYMLSAGALIYNVDDTYLYQWDGTNIAVPVLAELQPVAVDDAGGSFFGTTAVTTINVVTNDFVGDGVDLATGVAYVAASLSGTGTLGADPVYNGDGTFTYTPNGGETSDVTFDYRITDTDGDTSDGTVTLTYEAPAPPGVSYSDVVLLMNMEGADGSSTFTDQSGTPKTITKTGSPTIETDVYPNGAMFISSGANYLSAADNIDFRINNTVDILYEAWITPSTTNRLQMIFNKRAGSGNPDGIFIAVNDVDKIQARVFNGSSAVAECETVADFVDADTEYYVAVQRSTGGRWDLYVDAVWIATATESSLPSDSGSPQRFGYSGFTSGRELRGYSRGYRISRSAPYPTGTDYTAPTLPHATS